MRAGNVDEDAEGERRGEIPKLKEPSAAKAWHGSSFFFALEIRHENRRQRHARGERVATSGPAPLKMCWSPLWPWGIMCSNRLPGVLT